MRAVTQNNNLYEALKSFTLLSNNERQVFLNMAGGTKNSIAIDPITIDKVPSVENYQQLILKTHKAKAIKLNKKYKNTSGISTAYS